MLRFLLRGSPRSVLILAAVTIAAIALLDWRIASNIPLGFLYLFPMVLVGSAFGRWQVGAAALICTALTESFDNFDWSPESGIPRDILIFAAYFGIGVFVSEVLRNRKRERETEEELEALVESSPAAILTIDSGGQVLLANDAAHRLLGVAGGTLPGRTIHTFLPSLARIPRASQSQSSFRTVMQCRGRREDGEVFLADVWFSTYGTSAGSRLAAMVVDTSEELRDREEFNLQQLLAGSRILVAAVSHEIRNVCGAIAVVHRNLQRGGALAGNKDFEALGTLSAALEKIAAMELRQTGKEAAEVDVGSVLEELRIVVEPSLREQGAETQWEIAPELPRVWADRQSLMQVFLNLVKNSARAMEGRERSRIRVRAFSENRRVVVEVEDTGGGVEYPHRLFRPFQQDAQASGLGLYLSRAFARSFRGDLRYEPAPEGSRFVVELSVAYGTGDPDLAGGRPQPVSREPEPAIRG